MAYKNEIVINIIALRSGGLSISEIAKYLEMKNSQVMQIVKSKQYKEQTLVFCRDCQEIMDLTFISIAVKYANKSQYLLDNIIELVENENPRIKVEGLKLLSNQINSCREKVMSLRLVDIESKLEKIKADAY